MRGLRMIGDDQNILTTPEAKFDGRFEYYRRAVLLGREPA